MKKIILVIAAVALLASPAMAVDWNFYGSARMATFYSSRDFGDGLNAAGTDNEDAEVQWALQSNSRLGATVKGENVGGRFEFGINESNVSSRRIYGTWDFGAATLKVGKDYTPISQFISAQAFDGDLGLLGIGTMYGSRRGQVALSFGGFEIALIDASTGLVSGMDAAATVDAPATTALPTFVVRATNPAFTGGDVDEILPKIEAKFGMSFDTWNFAVAGGYQYYEIEDVVSPVDGTTDDVEVDSWTLGADGGVNFGPVYVKAAVSFGQNVGDAGWHIPGNRTSGGFATFDGDDDIDDVDTLMWALVGGFKFTDQLTFEGGVGWREDDSDAPGTDEDDALEAYINATIALAPGVWVIPEVGYRDYGDGQQPNVDEGDAFYLGAKWQIDF